MESLEFLSILVVGITVAGWYFINEEKGASGEIGLLALKPDTAAAPKKSRGRYRIKPRRATRPRDLRSVEDTRSAEGASPAYRVFDDMERARRRFRRQDEARYRVKDKLTDDFVKNDVED